MSSRIPKNILTDTGYWIALFDKGDNNHKEAISISEVIEKSRIVMPWPIYYEVLRTKFIKNRIIVANFSTAMKKMNIERVDDSPYRELALEETIRLSSNGKRNISLVDMVVRYILQDINQKINYLVTFNVKDFEDICKKRNIPIYSENNVL